MAARPTFHADLLRHVRQHQRSLINALSVGALLLGLARLDSHLVDVSWLPKCSKSDFHFTLRGVAPKGGCKNLCALRLVDHQESLQASGPDRCQVPLPNAPYDLIWYAATYRAADLAGLGQPLHDLCMCDMSVRMQRQIHVRE
jgi:hypothetical protein